MLNLVSGAMALWLLWNIGTTLKGRVADIEIPGSVRAGPGLYGIAIAGSLLILAAETGGEIVLGISEKQNVLPWYALVGILAAGVVEEVIFRGFVVFRRREEVRFVVTALGGSLIFAALHPYIWDFDGGFPWIDGSKKAWFSFAFVYLNSVWFYSLRFRWGNQTNSLLPCIVGHAASNLGVYLIKLYQGFIQF